MNWHDYDRGVVRYATSEEVRMAQEVTRQEIGRLRSEMRPLILLGRWLHGLWQRYYAGPRRQREVARIEKMLLAQFDAAPVGHFDAMQGNTVLPKAMLDA